MRSIMYLFHLERDDAVKLHKIFNVIRGMEGNTISVLLRKFLHHQDIRLIFIFAYVITVQCNKIQSITKDR